MNPKTPLNVEQKAAVTQGTGPLLIVAGAGTGKTTVVTSRIKYLILEKKIAPSNILALTFTEKAAREMEERVDIAMPYGYTQMWISTFHAFCDRILRNEAIHIGLNPAFTLTSEAEALQFVKKNLYSFDLSYFRPLGNPYKFIQGMLQHFSRLKDDDITPDAYLQYYQKIRTSKSEIRKDKDELKKISELAHAFKTYEELKTKNGIMDFSDLIANTLKLFRTRNNILTTYQKQFQYILVDEFQDTNFAQNELAILLSGNQKNITVVGDDDQAIYRWRGAALANITQFRTHFPKAKIVALTKNYRSTREILDKAYQLIQHNNPDRLEVTEKINKKLEAMRNVTGDEVTLLFDSRVDQEADAVVEKITTLIKKKSFSYKDFAILVRANDHAQPFTRALERERIPFQFLGPGQLFHQDEIKDLIAYLKVLYNFEDASSLYRVLAHPVFALEARDIAALLIFAKKQNTTLFETLERIDTTNLSSDAKEKGGRIVAMIHKHLKRVPKDTAGQLLYYFLDDSGLLQSFINPESALSEKRAQNIAKFFEKLKTYETTHEDASVFAVVDWIDLSMQLGESPLAADVDWTENNAVNILTIHSSKGLEFPVVFIVNLVTQRFPTRDRKEQIPIPEDLIKEKLPETSDNLSEERRLFYVAMTRARDNLFLTAAKYYGEGKRERKLSPFVYETLGEPYVNGVIEKKKAEESVIQLSLADIVEHSKMDDRKTTQVSTKHTQPPSISYSQIHTFDTCPLHYKLKYLLNIPSFPSAALSYGTSIHGVLRDYYRQKINGGQVKIPDIESLLKSNWISEGYTSSAHEKIALTQAKKVLQQYIAKNNATLPIAVESEFRFKVKDLPVVGRIDRVNKVENGKIEIIDYKTGSNIPDAKKVASDLQLSLYALAATEVKDHVFNKLPQDVLLSFHYIETDTKLTTTRTQEQLEDVKSVLLQKAAAIAESDFTCSIKNCKNCEYKILCQTFTS